MITARGARSLAYWLSVNEPAIYGELVRRAAGASPKFGECVSCRGGLHGFGQDITPLDVTPTVDVSTVDFSPPPMLPEITVMGTPDLAFTAVDPATFTPITVDQSSLTLPDVPGYTPLPPATTPSWLENVGNYLTTGGGITSLLNLGTQALRTQAAQSNVVAAQTVLNAQAARVMAGGNPAAISYRRDPVTGQVVPVLAGPTGLQYPVTHPLLNSLAPNASTLQVTSFLSQYGLYLAAGLVAILLIARR